MKNNFYTIRDGNRTLNEHIIAKLTHVHLVRNTILYPVDDSTQNLNIKSHLFSESLPIFMQEKLIMQNLLIFKERKILQSSSGYWLSVKMILRFQHCKY